MVLLMIALNTARDKPTVALFFCSRRLAVRVMETWHQLRYRKSPELGNDMSQAIVTMLVYHP
jgi:hypothetical protein